MGRKIGKNLLLVSVTLLISIFCIYAYTNQCYAEDDRFYIVEYSHNKTGIGKSMIEKNYSKDMQLEAINDDAYILYTNINRDKIQSYRLNFVENNKIINTSLLDKKENLDIYGSYILKADLNKKILISFYIPAMGKETAFEIQLSNYSHGQREIYKKAIQNKNKPSNYYYDFFNIKGEKLNNSSYFVGSINYENYKIAKVLKNNYYLANESLSLDMLRYKVDIEYINNEKQSFVLTQENYNKKLDGVDPKSISKLNILYYIEDGISETDSYFANTRLLRKITVNESLKSNEEQNNYSDLDIPNWEPHKKPGVNIMSLTISIVATVFGIFLLLVIILVILKKRRRNKN